MNFAERIRIDIRGIFQLVDEKRASDTESWVLMFHDVAEVPEPGNEEFTIKPCELMDLVSRLKLNGCSFICPEDLLKGRKGILLTFDDAYASVYEAAYPLFKEQGIPFTVFQTVEYLNLGKYLSERMICDMLESGYLTLGAHSVSHIDLAAQDRTNSYNNIAEASAALSDIFDTAITCFAYPYGSYAAVTRREKSFAKKAGYCMAFGTVAKSLPMHFDPYYIPRINVCSDNYGAVAERIAAAGTK